MSMVTLLSSITVRQCGINGLLDFGPPSTRPRCLMNAGVCGGANGSIAIPSQFLSFKIANRGFVADSAAGFQNHCVSLYPRN